MKPIYEENEETLEIAEQISCHIPPHLHKSMELVSVTECSCTVKKQATENKR